MACRSKPLFRFSIMSISNTGNRQRLNTAFLCQLCQIFHSQNIVGLLQNLGNLFSKNAFHCKFPRLSKGNSCGKLFPKDKLNLWVFQRTRCLFEQRKVCILGTERQKIHASHRLDQLYCTKCKTLCPCTGVTDRQFQNQICSIL